MQLYEGHGGSPAVPFDDAIRLLHEHFAQGWRARKGEIVELMRSFRYNNEAIRAIIRQHVVDDDWPMMRGSQSFYLHSSPQFRIRANLWFPASHPLAKEKGYQEYLSIEKCHNHDFDFFTICVHGSGYGTRYYRARDYSTDLQVGDHIRLDPIKQFCLGGDAVLSVERDLDFHSQLWPETFSVTVNLIPQREIRYSTQYTVEEETGRIERRIETDAGPQADERSVKVA